MLTLLSWHVGCSSAVEPCESRTKLSEDVLAVPTEYPTIQAAVDAAAHGQIVCVLAGTYSENIVIDVDSDSLEMLSDSGPDTTVLDGGGQGSVVSISGSEGEVVVGGFTITNGSGTSVTDDDGNTSVRGGGVYIDTKNVSIKNVVVTGNTADDLGGGVYCQGHRDVDLFDVTITDNSSGLLGGGLAAFCDVEYLRGVVDGNVAQDEGGGVYGDSFVGTEVTVTNNTAIEGNGGGVAQRGFDTRVSLTDSVVSGNSGRNGGGASVCCDRSTLTLRGSEIHSNEAEYTGGGVLVYDGSSVELEDGASVHGNDPDDVYER